LRFGPFVLNPGAGIELDPATDEQQDRVAEGELVNKDTYTTKLD
jgi:hypothetical protein